MMVCACVLSHFSHVRLCNPMDCSLPGSSVHGILQAKILEWVTVSSSRASSQPRDQRSLFCLVLWQADSLPLVPPGKPTYRKSQGLSSHICKMGLYHPVTSLCPQSHPRTTSLVSLTTLIPLPLPPQIPTSCHLPH